MGGSWQKLCTSSSRVVLYVSSQVSECTALDNAFLTCSYVRAASQFAVLYLLVNVSILLCVRWVVKLRVTCRKPWNASSVFADWPIVIKWFQFVFEQVWKRATVTWARKRFRKLFVQCLRGIFKRVVYLNWAYQCRFSPENFLSWSLIFRTVLERWLSNRPQKCTCRQLKLQFLLVMISETAVNVAGKDMGC